MPKVLGIKTILGDREHFDTRFTLEEEGDQVSR